MRDIGIGIIGGGYMGKAHAVAMSAVGPVFETVLRPRLVMVCATSDASAERYRAAYGFARATSDWRKLVLYQPTKFHLTNLCQHHLHSNGIQKQ